MLELQSVKDRSNGDRLLTRIRSGLLIAALYLSNLACPGAVQDQPIRWDKARSHGTEIACRIRGEGDPVLLLSGGPGFSGEPLAGVFEIVARSHKAILPDQRGTGRSASPFEPGPMWTVEGAVADLEMVRRQSGHERWIIVGHSWGARLAMAYTAAHPDRVAGLVLVSPGGLDASFYEDYHANLFARLGNEQLQELRELPRPPDDSPDLAGYTAKVFRIFIPAMLENQAAAEELHRYLDDATVFEPRATLNMNRASLNLDLRGKLSDYKDSCVIIRGEQDPISRAAVDKIAEQIGQTTIIEIDGAAHWPFLENAEHFNAALTKALALIRGD